MTFDVQLRPTSFFRLDARFPYRTKAASNLPNLSNLFRAYVRARASLAARISTPLCVRICVDMLDRLDAALFSGALRASTIQNEVGLDWTRVLGTRSGLRL